MTEQLTITNPEDPTKTYTYGKRGRKPTWVMEWEKTNPDKIPTTHQKSTSTSEPVVGPNGKVWSGRGRKPKWLVEREDLSEAIRRHKGWRIWRFIGSDNNPIVDCFVVAKNVLEAMAVINRTVAYPLGPNEFELLWKEVSGESLEDTLADNLRPSIWEFNKTNESWEERPVKNTSYKVLVSS